MIHFDPTKPTPLRRACDRCHQSKLKCFRDNDNEDCQRCMRANVKCTSSPPTRPQRKTWATTIAGAGTGITTWDSSPTQATRLNADVRPQGSTPTFEDSAGTTLLRMRGASSTSVPEDTSMTVFEAPSGGDLNPARYSNPNGSWHGPTSAGNSGAADFSHLMTDFLNSHQLSSPLLPEVDAYMDMIMDQDQNQNQPRPNTSATNMAGMTQPEHSHFTSSDNVSRTAPSSPPRPCLASYSARLSSATTLAPSSTSGRSGFGREGTASGTERKGNGRIYWLRQISDVNINLMEHLDTVVQCLNSCDDANSRQQNPFGIDDTLHLSQRFIDVLTNICSRLPATNKGASNSPSTLPSSSFSLDPAAELLIFSAYLRLIETHHRVLRHVQLSLAPDTLNYSTRCPLQMPGLTIGSFSLSSKSDTQSLLLVNLMETMMTQARDLVAEISSPKHTAGYRGDFKVFGGVSLVIVPDLALKAIRSREDSLSRMFHDLKDSIRSVDYREPSR
ncbi:hypothetical protein GGS20DRAFT_497411 [Poronia punctata]|nr:hypothetical protein GGS20DRAFT_497411 [Poronia punctata]